MAWAFSGIVSGPDSAIYGVQSDDVARLNSDGSFTLIPIPSSGSIPVQLAVGGDKNLDFTESFSAASTPNAQIGPGVLPPSSVVASPIAPSSVMVDQSTSTSLSFHDLSTAVNASNFAATIIFGDNSGNLVNGVDTGLPGTVVPDGNGGFTVSLAAHLHESRQYAIKGR